MDALARNATNHIRTGPVMCVMDVERNIRGNTIRNYRELLSRLRLVVYPALGRSIESIQGAFNVINGSKKHTV